MKTIGLTILKIALAIALAWYVIDQIEPRDRLVGPVTEDESPRAVLYGSVEGDWRGEEWTFHCGEDTEQQAALFGAAPYAVLQPADLAAAQEAGWALRPGFFLERHFPVERDLTLPAPHLDLDLDLDLPPRLH